VILLADDDMRSTSRSHQWMQIIESYRALFKTWWKNPGKNHKQKVGMKEWNTKRIGRREDLKKKSE